ncbi:PqiC family protein [Glaciimonas sp. GG7]
MTSTPRRLYTIVTALLLTGCAITPTRFYTLATAPQLKTLNTATKNIYIEVPAIGVPERLARPQMVVRTQQTQVAILEQDRWASSFNYELRDALASGLANRLGAVDVSRGGRPAGLPVYRIAIELREFDAAPADKVQALFGWTISRSDDGKSAACQLAVTEPVGASMDALVAGVQRAVAEAVVSIARDVTGLAAGNTMPCKGI